MWSALFKYILTTAVICASQSLSSPEEAYLEERRKKTGCLLSATDDEERGAQRCGCRGLKKKRAGLYSVATFVENIHRRLNEGGGATPPPPPHTRRSKNDPKKAFRRLDGGARSIVFGVGEIT